MDVWTNGPSADGRFRPSRPVQHIKLNFNCNVLSLRQWQSLPTGEGIEMNLSVNRSENIEIFYFALRNCFVHLKSGIHRVKPVSSRSSCPDRTVRSLAIMDVSRISLIKNKTFESTASKIEITLSDDNDFEKSETGKTESNKRPQLKMQLEQYNQKSFMYYQKLSENNLNESLSVNITDKIKKLDINKTTPISLKEMVLLYFARSKM